MEKRITIYELKPLLEIGWVAMDMNGTWWWFQTKPERWSAIWMNKKETAKNTKLSSCFDIAPFDGDWKDSLVRIKKAGKGLTRNDIEKIMQSPKYWRDQDPESLKIVSDWFEKMED